MTKCVLCLASGVTLCRSSDSMTRQPRPFICSKYDGELMFRMKSRHSSGFTSVPVAIMSTVTAMRGIVRVAELVQQVFGLLAGASWT